MNFCLIVLLTCSLLMAGCGRKHAERAPAAELSLSTTNEPLAGAVDPFMTSQLQIFIQEKGRLPADFGELARTRLDSIPRAPEGMKWAIDPVSREVKLVKGG